MNLRKQASKGKTESSDQDYQDCTDLRRFDSAISQTLFQRPSIDIFASSLGGKWAPIQEEKPSYTLMFPEDMTANFRLNATALRPTNSGMSTGLSRRSSNNDAFSFFRIREPETQDITALVKRRSSSNKSGAQNSQVKGEGDGLADMMLTRSRSKNKDGFKEAVVKKEKEIEDIIHQMIESNHLQIDRELSQEEKVLISCIVSIQSEGKKKVNSNKKSADFVVDVNKNLVIPNDKRSDDRLRWIYKRFIRHLLVKETDYRPNKNHRREDYMADLTKIYFPKDWKDMKDELENSKFASKKKLKMLFSKSLKFKEDFLEYTDNILDEYREEALNKYKSMFEAVKEAIVKGKDVSKDCIIKDRRLPWRDQDVLVTVDQIKKVSK